MKNLLQLAAILVAGLLPVALFAGEVSGRIKLPAGETIPPGANVQVELRDVSKADAASMLVGKADVKDGGGKSDAAFTIKFDDAKLLPENSYAVSCRITHKGKLLFINDTHIPVLTRGAPAKDVELPVNRVKR
jgi:putative lipoprotein